MLRAENAQKFSQPMPFLGMLTLFQRFPVSNQSETQARDIVQFMTGQSVLPEDLFDNFGTDPLIDACWHELRRQLYHELDDITKPPMWSTDVCDKWVAYQCAVHDETYPVFPLLVQGANYQMYGEVGAAWQLLHVGFHMVNAEITNSQLVICRVPYSDQVQCWPIDDFLGEVKLEDNQVVRRFRYSDIQPASKDDSK